MPSLLVIATDNFIDFLWLPGIVAEVRLGHVIHELCARWAYFVVETKMVNPMITVCGWRIRRCVRWVLGSKEGCGV